MDIKYTPRSSAEALAYSEQWHGNLRTIETSNLKRESEYQSVPPKNRLRLKRKSRNNPDPNDKGTFILAALCAHHGYDDGIVSNPTPINQRRFAKQNGGEGLSRRFTITDVQRFFEMHFGDHGKYTRLCTDARGLGRKLRSMRGEAPGLDSRGIDLDSLE